MMPIRLPAIVLTRTTGLDMHRGRSSVVTAVEVLTAEDIGNLEAIQQSAAGSKRRRIGRAKTTR